MFIFPTPSWPPFPPLSHLYCCPTPPWPAYFFLAPTFTASLASISSLRSKYLELTGRTMKWRPAPTDTRPACGRWFEYWKAIMMKFCVFPLTVKSVLSLQHCNYQTLVDSSIDSNWSNKQAKYDLGKITPQKWNLLENWVNLGITESAGSSAHLAHY